MIHTVKGFSIVNEAEVDVFLEFSCFLYDPGDADSLVCGFSAFLKSILYILKFLVHILLKPAWRILSITLLTREMSATVQEFEHSLILPSFEIEMKTDHFNSCGHCEFSKFADTSKCNTLVALFFLGF